MPSCIVASPYPVHRCSGNIVDIEQRRVFGGTIEVENGRIRRIIPDAKPRRHRTFLLPGFVDAHVHVESSLLVPSEFARLAMLRGTVATISDPHEIGNVLGVAGVEYMIENARSAAPFHFCWGAPSCVPATSFETAGAIITAAQVADLLARPEVGYLSEVMNFPGVLNGDADMLAKIAAAKRAKKPVDGHAPGLRGNDAAAYARAGIATDHECRTFEEGKDRLANKMYLLIREGSAARNFDALIDLLKEHSDRCMFCTDDAHPHELERGHIDALVRRAVTEKGVNLFDALKAACVNPVRHYALPIGLLREGDRADFIEVDSLRDFTVLRTVIDGLCVASHGESLLHPPKASLVNRFEATPKFPADFALNPTCPLARIIEVCDGQLVTGKALVPTEEALTFNKIAVVNRYAPDAPPAVGYVRGVDLQRGALASSVAHDSHNIVAVGATDADLCRAVNRVIEHSGGLAAVCADDGLDGVLPLPVAGIMTNEDAFAVAHRYEELDRQAKSLGTPLAAPFMTLSFLALLVIPSLKMSDKGLFDGDAFQLVDVFARRADDGSIKA